MRESVYDGPALDRIRAITFGELLYDSGRLEAEGNSIGSIILKAAAWHLVVETKEPPEGYLSRLHESTVDLLEAR